LNSSVGNFEIEKSQKDNKDENFEEIYESKELIEERINKIKN